jgi:hypothetical protein
VGTFILILFEDKLAKHGNSYSVQALTTFNLTITLGMKILSVSVKLVLVKSSLKFILLPKFSKA